MGFYHALDTSVRDMHSGEIGRGNTRTNRKINLKSAMVGQTIYSNVRSHIYIIVILDGLNM